MGLEYNTLAEGCTMSGQFCPLCEKYGVLSVSRLNRQILWFCHRASCGFRRGKKYDGTLPALEVKPEEERAVQYPKVDTLSITGYQFLEETYGLSKVSVNRAGMGCLYHEGVQALYYYMPLFNVKNEPVGYNLKVAIKGIQPKNIMKTSFPSVSAWYPNTTKTKSILVVEDQLSAIRASEYLTSVSILGTHLNDRKVEELLVPDPPVIYLALDADAFAKAMKYIIQYRAKTNGRMKLVKLDKDVKNMDSKEFEEFIEGLV